MKCFNAFDVIGARNEIRTRDPDLGKVVLYQLSYSRLFFLVREERLELSHPKIPDPKSGASANSATLANIHPSEVNQFGYLGAREET